MLQTVRNNLTTIKKVNVRTKASKFSRLFQTEPTVDTDEHSVEEILSGEKISEYIKSEEIPQEVCTNEESDELSEYIVENPDEAVVEFPIVSSVELAEKLPFFKSISFKLASIYG